MGNKDKAESFYVFDVETNLGHLIVFPEGWEVAGNTIPPGCIPGTTKVLIPVEKK